MCKPWDEVNTCKLLLGRLSFLHVDVLNICCNAPLQCLEGDKYTGASFVKFFSEKSAPSEEYMFSVTEHFNNYDPSILKYIAADLKGMGLLEQTGEYVFDTEYVMRISDAGIWFNRWVQKKL